MLSKSQIISQFANIWGFILDICSGTSYLTRYIWDHWWTESCISTKFKTLSVWQCKCKIWWALDPWPVTDARWIHSIRVLCSPDTLDTCPGATPVVAPALTSPHLSLSVPVQQPRPGATSEAWGRSGQMFSLWVCLMIENERLKEGSRDESIRRAHSK